MVLLSDGVPEARTEKGELYGFDRLGPLTLMPAKEIANTAKIFGAKDAQPDDITVLTIACLPVESQAEGEAGGRTGSTAPPPRSAGTTPPPPPPPSRRRRRPLDRFRLHRSAAAMPGIEPGWFVGLLCVMLQ